MSDKLLSPKSRPNFSTERQQIVRMQSVLFDAMNDPECERRDKAALATAFARLSERKQTIDMKPSPKAIDVTDRRKRKRKVNGAAQEPSDAPPLEGAAGQEPGALDPL